MKHYPAEFKADAVALYRSRPGATIKSVAGDLGVNTETLRNWIRAAGERRPGAYSTQRAAAQASGDDTTPAAGTPASASDLRSPTRTPSNQQQLS
ncbi:transposase [Streptomyces sp. NPDC001549]|uniref:transposase n=1 Tax=Streptomyces sp. NPDC001549 TaxID=3364586 RepID=UPI0036C521A2